MALVKGTNCGFVLAAPTTDPSGASETSAEDRARAGKFISPADAIAITKIGWWCANVTEEANFEVGLYSHDADNNVPLTLLASNKINAKGTTAGWKSALVSLAINPSTVYWIAFQLDHTNTSSKLDLTYSGAEKTDRDVTPISTLPDPTWNTAATNPYLIAVYAVYIIEVPPNPYPTRLLKKNLVSGYHCFMSAYLHAKRKGYDPLKLPDGTIF